MRELNIKMKTSKTLTLTKSRSIKNKKINEEEDEPRTIRGMEINEEEEGPRRSDDTEPSCRTAAIVLCNFSRFISLNRSAAFGPLVNLN